MTDLNQMVTTIRANIVEAQAYSNAVQAKMNELALNMYPSLPSEQWQTRNGDNEYLFMLFKMDGQGRYQGPDGKRKLYVGRDPQKIEAARQMAANTVQWQELDRTRLHLKRWIRNLNHDVESLISRAEMLSAPSYPTHKAVARIGVGGVE